ncbi:MAG TPA: iron ABC transporter permease [Vitreimonas sp.]|uniref:ABC transporter permease n=1 Tax=Vitreimonas sp. TaxID=3069702 RepID=UPI002D243A6D|nr:iron ABC transporter permease [Vitreimonas sp.]HYD86118.1 iron ABC transporter permease [Vitreimonas sp.]
MSEAGVLAPSKLGLRIDGVALVATLATLICAAPALAVFGLALTRADAGAAFGGDLLRDGAIGTAALMLAGGGGAIVFGAAAAWLVSLCRFPGRQVFEWLLVVPLAAPSYILAYAYASLTWAGGVSPIPVEGFWGAAFVYAIGLYPYVYLAARAAFASQSSCALEAARTLGAKPATVLWRVALPLARPGIAAGGALAMMEIAADYGAAHHFGLTTLSTAIFRAWYAHGAPSVALQISAVLLLGALVFLVLERWARGRASYAGASSRWRPLPRYGLGPLGSTLAIVFCGALIGFGALAPLAWLTRLALLHANVEDVAGPFLNSILLSGGGALATLVLASAIAVAARRASGIGKVSLYAAAMGYAAPGAVIAMGALALFGVAREAGWIGGLGAGLAMFALIWSYAARFASAGVQPIDAGLARLSKGLDASARTLGAGPWRRFAQIDLPIAAPSLAAAALILFVEILKELPATLILRPFDFDTLAVKAYAYASDERLLEAATPALLIFLAGLAPILLLSRGIGRSRPGQRPALEHAAQR